MENEFDIEDVLDQIDEAIILLSTKNKSITMLELSTLILSRLDLISDAMDSREDFNKVMLYAIDKKIEEKNEFRSEEHTSELQSH